MNESIHHPNPDPPPTVLFDGTCGLCDRTVRFVHTHDRTGTIRFTPLESELGRELLTEAGLDPDDVASVVFLEHGHAYRRSEATLAMARYFEWPWRALRLGRWVPRPLRDAAYRLVARLRYALFGRVETCGLPDEALRERVERE